MGDDDDTVSAGGEGLRKSFGGYAADAEDGDLLADGGLDGGDVFKTDTGATFFGGGGKERAEADVVEALGEGGLGLDWGMGGTAVEDRLAEVA